jgi:tetratricopeptide (TPR) repeat protein
MGTLGERVGHYTAALRWYGRARNTLAGEGDQQRAAMRAQLAVAYAGVRYRQGKLRDCVRWAKEAVGDAEAAGGLSILAHAYYILDAALTDLGSAECETYRELALPIYEKIGDLLGQANVLNNLGIDAYYEGDWNAALELYERSRGARERAGDVVGAATAANNIGEILSDQGHLTQAEALFRQARQVFRNANYPVGVYLATSNLGRAAGRAGRVEEAIELLSSALEGFRAIRAESFVLETQARLAELLVRSERYDQALALSAAMKPRAGEAGSAVVAMVLRTSGEAMAGLGMLDEARAELEESLQVGRTAMVMFEVGLTLRSLASVLRVGGREVQAASLESEAAEILTPLGVGARRSLLMEGAR